MILIKTNHTNCTSKYRDDNFTFLCQNQEFRALHCRAVWYCSAYSAHATQQNQINISRYKQYKDVNITISTVVLNTYFEFE